MNNNINTDIAKDFNFFNGRPYSENNSVFYLNAGSILIPAARTQNRAAKISYTLVFAILMAISANTFTYLPFTPIPVTMQVLTVLISAIALGSRLAFLSQLQYVLAGLLGAPVFAGFKSGPLAFSGPTGGYIIGFLAAAFVTGYIYENNLHVSVSKFFKQKDSNTVSIFICCVSGVLVIYSFGFLHLFGFIYMAFKTSDILDIFEKTVKLGVMPFILIDILKILVIINLDKISKLKKLV